MRAFISGLAVVFLMVWLEGCQSQTASMTGQSTDHPIVLEAPADTVPPPLEHPAEVMFRVTALYEDDGPLIHEPVQVTPVWPLTNLRFVDPNLQDTTDAAGQVLFTGSIVGWVLHESSRVVGTVKVRDAVDTLKVYFVSQGLRSCGLVVTAQPDELVGEEQLADSVRVTARFVSDGFYHPETLIGEFQCEGGWLSYPQTIFENDTVSVWWHARTAIPEPWGTFTVYASIEDVLTDSVRITVRPE